MKLNTFIARRYLFSSKKKNIINVISTISVLIVAVVTCSLLVVLSGFNGLDSLVKGLYKTFDSDIVILPKKGKTFVVTEHMTNTLKSMEEVELFSEVIQDNALVKYNENQMVVTLKGVSSNYFEKHSIDSAIVHGSKRLTYQNLSFTVLGQGIIHQLQMPLENQMYPVQFIYPKNIKYTGVPNAKLLSIKNIHYGGTFSLEKSYDEQYAFVPLEFAAELTEFKNKRTGIEMLLKDKSQIKEVKNKLIADFGSEFDILDSDDLHSTLFKAHNLEKLFVNLIFILILMVASLNIFFALSMLVMEKRKDIATLKTLGFSNIEIRNVFLYTGFYISGIGILIGLILGYGLIFLQLQTGFVSMQMESALVSAYPVEIRIEDFFITIVIVLITTFLVSYLPALKASKIEINSEI